MEPDHTPILIELNNPENFLTTVDHYLKNGIKFGVAADFDENIATYSEINPEIRLAIINLIAAGIDVAILSSRGAKDVAQRVDIPGIRIIGTLGWETLDENGLSHIDERFKPFQPQITGILRDVREKFLTEQLGRQAEVADEPNIRLETREGHNINLQRKGYNEEYPEGINSTWALSELPQETQNSYKKVLKQYYDEAFTNHTASMTKDDIEELRKLCGFQIREGIGSDGEKTLDVEIRPMSQNAKSNAMIQLMREPGDQKRKKHYDSMPYNPAWIYSGDNPVQDGPVMRAGHSADFFSRGARKMFGIWSKPSYEEKRPIRGVDVIVDGVAGNAKLMTKIASRVTQHFMKKTS